MDIDLQGIKEHCASLAKDVALAYPGLSLYFLFHRRGKLRESIALAEHDVVAHPAGSAARAILKRNHQNDKSSFLGLAVRQESKWFGFQKIDHLLGLVNINQDDFKTEKELTLSVYHHIWHAIDLYNIRLNPAHRNRFRSGPIIPKRSDMNLSKANLQADAFSAILGSIKGETDCLDFISANRGKNTLLPITDIKAENYPSIIAMDACRVAIDDLPKYQREEENIIKLAHKVSIDIGHTFDSSSIQQWWDFSIPAQDMAWRGYEQQDILSAAVHTSNSPFVRSIGYLIQEVTGIEPSLTTAIENNYNAFVDPDVNMKLHRELVDTIFEEAIFQGEEEQSSRALLNAANKQNEGLTEGRFLGWCANALQDAAKAFERALLNGASPTQAARMQFEGNREEPSWDTLKDLGDSIIDQRRQGFAVTMGHIAEICHNNDAFAPVLGAIKMTMNDPSYVQKLEAANDLAMAPKGPQPQGLEPNAPTPKAPALQKNLGPKTPTPNVPAMPAPGPSMPGMGGGSANRTAHMMRQRQLMAQKLKDKNNSDDRSGDKT